MCQHYNIVANKCYMLPMDFSIKLMYIQNLYVYHIEDFSLSTNYWFRSNLIHMKLRILNTIKSTYFCDFDATLFSHVLIMCTYLFKRVKKMQYVLVDVDPTHGSSLFSLFYALMVNGWQFGMKKSKNHQIVWIICRFCCMFKSEVFPSNTEIRYSWQITSHECLLWMHLRTMSYVNPHRTLPELLHPCKAILAQKVIFILG